jgi:outer membrane protein assembly factor BamA
MRLAILALLTIVAVPRLPYAQSLNCRNQPSRVSPTAQNIKITIADVEFSGENPLSNDTRAALLNRIKQDLSVLRQGDDSEWLGQIEVPIRDTLEKQGYFRAVTRSTPYLTLAEAQELHYVVNVEIDSGRQYRLDEIHFSGETVFAAAELRASFSLHHGDLFDPSEIRAGMESMKKLYDGKGFIDMVPQPETNIDEKSGLIDVLLKVDEGNQFHVRTVEIFGLDLQVEQSLKSQLVPGQVFDERLFWNLLEQDKAAVPTDVTFRDLIQVRRDATSSSVDLLVDFRPCPKP